MLSMVNNKVQEKGPVTGWGGLSNKLCVKKMSNIKSAELGMRFTKNNLAQWGSEKTACTQISSLLYWKTART